MKGTYENQIMNVCIQTFYNLYGYLPGDRDLAHMLGKDYEKIQSTNCKHAS